MFKIVNRKELIDFLLRRKFGSLAPAPPPTLASSIGEANGARDNSIENSRAEFEAMDTTALQQLVDDANKEAASKEREFAAQCHAMRETYWPHWAKKDLWSEIEFATLCCGLVPEERGKPGDPGKARSGDFHTIAINRANDDIRRGTLSKTLIFVPRHDADTAATMYGTGRHYVPAIAVEWAASRFDTFPPTLLDAVRNRAQAMEVTEESSATRWPWGNHETELLRNLAVAGNKFWALYDPTEPSTAPTNDAVVKWLKAQGVADRNAQVMATMLRADGLPSGPRK